MGAQQLCGIAHKRQVIYLITQFGKKMGVLIWF